MIPAQLSAVTDSRKHPASVGAEDSQWGLQSKYHEACSFALKAPSREASQVRRKGVTRSCSRSGSRYAAASYFRHRQEELTHCCRGDPRSQAQQDSQTK